MKLNPNDNLVIMAGGVGSRFGPWAQQSVRNSLLTCLALDVRSYRWHMTALGELSLPRMYG